MLLFVWRAGDVPRVDGQLAVARAFGDKSLKDHLSVEPDIKEVRITAETELLILASDGLWKVRSQVVFNDSFDSCTHQA